MSAAEAWFIAATIPLILASGLHALYSVLDTVRPRRFAPIDRPVQAVVEGTGIRLIGKPTPSMWRVWLGINISHGLGVFIFGLMCLILATHDFRLVTEIAALRPLTIAFSATYFILSLRFWFYMPTIITGTATICFTVAAVISA